MKKFKVENGKYEGALIIEADSLPEAIEIVAGKGTNVGTEFVNAVTSIDFSEECGTVKFYTTDMTDCPVQFDIVEI